MLLTVGNLLAIRQADIKINHGLTLLVGQNGTGKTSILRALAALLCRAPIPTGDDNKGLVLRGQSGAMVRRGEKSASASLTTEAGEVSISWPKNAFVGSLPVQTGPMQGGLVQWRHLSVDDRRSMLAAMLKQAGVDVVPTDKDLQDAFDRGSVSPHVRSRISLAGGWDFAAKKAGEEALKAKGEWQAATREHYGDVKAVGWVPAGYVHGQTLEQLQEEVRVRTAAVEDGIGRMAVDQSRIDAVRVVADKPMIDTQPLLAKIAALDVEIAELRASPPVADSAEFDRICAEADAKKGEALDSIREVNAGVNNLLPVPKELEEDNADLDCPSCKVGIVYKGVGLPEVATIFTAEQIEASRQAIRDAVAENDKIKASNSEIRDETARLQAVWRGLEDEVMAATQAFRKTQLDLQTAHSAKIKELIDAKSLVNLELRSAADGNAAISHAKSTMAKMLADSEGKTVTQAQMEVLRADLQTANGAMNAFAAKTNADRAQSEVCQWLAAKAILDPSGLRATKLQEGMVFVNQRLAAICATAGWPIVSLSSEMDLSIGGHLPALLSRGHQLTCQYAIQFLFASLEDYPAQIVLLDQFDTVSGSVRSGVVALTKAAPSMIVVAAFMGPMDLAERMAGNGIATYWIEDGEARKVG